MRTSATTPRLMGWTYFTSLLTFLVVCGCASGPKAKPGHAASIRHDEHSDVQSAREEFIGRLQNVLEDKSLPQEEHRQAAILLARVGQTAGPRYLVTRAQTAGENREIGETFFWLDGLIKATIPNEFIVDLCKSEDVNLQLAGAMMACSPVEPDTVSVLRRLVSESEDPRVVGYAAMSLGANGEPHDVVVLYRTASTGDAGEDIRRAARFGLGRFWGSRDEMTPGAFRKELQGFLQFIEDPQLEGKTVPPER